MSAEEVSMVSGWETKAYSVVPRSRAADPILVKDIYLAFLRHRINGDSWENWNNFADGKVYGEPSEDNPDSADWDENEKLAYTSAEYCKMVCDTTEDCLSWTFGEAECRISWSFAMGTPEAGKSSGWLVDRIHASVRAQNCPENVDWQVVAGMP
jgi:hypothetical protein